MTHHYRTHCSCGAVSLDLRLPQPIQGYQPRACDCDFCMLRSASYLSDFAGELSLTAAETPKQFSQGSGQARFLCCSRCDSLVAVIYQDEQCPLSERAIIGAVNASLPWVDSRGEAMILQPALSASPRLLSAADKLERWRKLWLKIIFNEKQ